MKTDMKTARNPDKEEGGWGVTGVPSEWIDGAPNVGPYMTKADADEARLGLKDFFRYALNEDGTPLEGKVADRYYFC